MLRMTAAWGDRQPFGHGDFLVNRQNYTNRCMCMQAGHIYLCKVCGIEYLYVI